LAPKAAEVKIYISGRKKEWKLVKKGIFSPCCIFSPQLGKWGN
jgi:hypothetical protein